MSTEAAVQESLKASSDENRGSGSDLPTEEQEDVRVSLEPSEDEDDGEEEEEDDAEPNVSRVKGLDGTAAMREQSALKGGPLPDGTVEEDTAEPQDKPQQETSSGETDLGTEGQAQTTSTDNDVAPAGPVFKPTLRGTYMDEEGVWSGEWAMSAKEFETGLRGKFEYKRDKKVPDEDIGKPAIVEGQPRDMYVSGHFMLLQGSKMRKIPEKDILIRFSAAEDGSINVQGFGKNNIGTFTLNGTYDVPSSMLSLEREYQKPPAVAGSGTSAQQKAKVKKAATPRPTPRVPRLGSSPNDATWGNASTAPTGPAAAVSQRIRRAPSHLTIDDAEIESNRRNTAKMLPIVEKLLREDRDLFFHMPVDPVLLGIPQYPEIITDPMDLGTIKQNLLSGKYESEEQVADHVTLTFNNAMVFNPKETKVHTSAQALLQLFETEREKIPRKVSADNKEQKDKKRKSAVGAAEPKRVKGMGRQSSSMRSEGSRQSSAEDEEDYDEGQTVQYSKPTKSSRRSTSSAAQDAHASSAGAPPMENEELRLLRRQVEMMSQQLESLKAVTIQSQQLTIQSQALHHQQLVAASPRGSQMDMDYLQPAVAPKRPRAPPKPKLSRSPYGTGAPAAALADMDDDAGAGRAPKAERALSYQEKRALGQDINKLPADKVQKVIDIIAESGSQMIGDGTEEVEIDIEKLDTPTLKALQRYVREVLRVEKKKAIKEGAL